MTSRAGSKGDAALIPPGTPLILPPDTAAAPGHDVKDLLGAGDRIEVNDRVVAQTHLVHVALNLLK